MKEYLFGCIILSLIAAIATEFVPKSLEGGVKSAIGAGLIVFAAIPLGSMITQAITTPLPDFQVPDTNTDGFHEISESAYKDGVRRLLADRYSCEPENFIVTLDGFNSQTLDCDILHITLTGKAVYLDYKAMARYVEENLEVSKCDVQIEFS